MSKRVTNHEVLRNFINGIKYYNGQHMSLSIRNYVLYSYETPIAVHADNAYDFIVNEMRYSPTTTKHQNALTDELDRKLKTYYKTSVAGMMKHKKGNV